MEILALELEILEIQRQHNQLENRQVWSTRSNAFNTQSPVQKQVSKANRQRQIRVTCVVIV